MEKIYRYSLKLVRERGVQYEVIDGCDTAIKSCLKFFKDFIDSPVEKVGVIVNDVKNSPIGYFTVSMGTTNASLVDPRSVFSVPVQLMAYSIILCHNHPSGDLTPSYEDDEVTKRLTAAGELLNIKVLDHIIIGRHPNTLKSNGVSIRYERCI